MSLQKRSHTNTKRIKKLVLQYELLCAFGDRILFTQKTSSTEWVGIRLILQAVF